MLILSIVIWLLITTACVVAPKPTPGPVKYSCSTELNKCICTQDTVVVSCIPSINESGDVYERKP
jgi:hypothetical protein